MSSEQEVDRKPQKGEVLLQADSVRYGYGDLVAVWDVSLEAKAGEAVAIVGRNGAGKTTLMFGLAGVLPAMSGTVSLMGKDVTKRSPWNRAHDGLCLVPEGKRIFPELTVTENLLLGVPRGVGPKERKERVNAILERFPMLYEKRTHLAGSCSGGQAQLLSVAASMAVQPKVLMVDEPSSGLAPVMVDQIMATLHELKDEGMAIILVEQLVEEVVTGIADLVVVIEGGRVVQSAVPEDISLEDLEKRLYVA